MVQNNSISTSPFLIIFKVLGIIEIFNPFPEIAFSKASSISFRPKIWIINP
jgi:hypothetical protein